MRGFEFGLACGAIGAISLALATVASAEAPGAATTTTAGPAVEAPQDDYYTRRARGILEAEKTTGSKPHPLARSYPGMDIVVCEAGCPSHGTPSVVYVRRTRSPVEAAREGRMVVTSDDSGSAPAPGTADVDAGITCIAGCYGDSETFAAMPSPVGEWATHTDTVVPERDKLSPVR